MLRFQKERRNFELQPFALVPISRLQMFDLLVHKKKQQYYYTSTKSIDAPYIMYKLPGRIHFFKRVRRERRGRNNS